MSAPQYLYKIVPSSAAPPNPLPDRLPVSDLDTKDGFIHLSTAKQVLGTLNLFFGEDEMIYLLRLSYARVKDQIKWETSQGAVEGAEGQEGYFPHLYNDSQLGKNEVESVSSVDKARGDEWEEGLAPLVSSGWLAC